MCVCCTHTEKHIKTYRYTNIYTNKHAYTCKCEYVYVYIYIKSYVIYTYTYRYIYIHIYTYTHVYSTVKQVGIEHIRKKTHLLNGSWPRPFNPRLPVSLMLLGTPSLPIWVVPTRAPHSGDWWSFTNSILNISYSPRIMIWSLSLFCHKTVLACSFIWLTLVILLASILLNISLFYSIKMV